MNLGQSWGYGQRLTGQKGKVETSLTLAAKLPELRVKSRWFMLFYALLSDFSSVSVNSQSDLLAAHLELKEQVC